MIDLNMPSYTFIARTAEEQKACFALGPYELRYLIHLSTGILLNRCTKSKNGPLRSGLQEFNDIEYGRGVFQMEERLKGPGLQTKVESLQGIAYLMNRRHTRESEDIAYHPFWFQEPGHCRNAN